MGRSADDFPTTQPRRVLVFLKETGCEFCAEAEPEVDAFARAHRDVEVRKIDLLVESWPEDLEMDEPTSIPSYLLFDPPFAPRTIEGRVVKTHELERWVYRRG